MADDSNNNNSMDQAPFAVDVQGGPDENAFENYKNYGMDIPTAPLPPAEHSAMADTPQQTEIPSKQTEIPSKKRSSRHLLYSVEILVFSLVGWGWLAMREYLGATPVLDISVLLCLLISSIVNFALSMVYHTTDQFKPAAQAFFAHTLSLWALYVYGLSESVTARSSPLCCKGVSSYSLSKTYTVAYFGGLPFHQAAGMVTVSFLSVLNVISAAQVRVCLEDPREWLTLDFFIAVVCLLSMHLGLFAISAGVCDVDWFGLGVIVVAGVMLAVMLHIPEDIVELFEWISGLLPKKRANTQTNAQADTRANTQANTQANRKTKKTKKESHPVLVLVQKITELLSTALLAGMTAVLSFKLGGDPSLLLLVVFGVVVLCQMGAVLSSLVEVAVTGKSNSKTPRQQGNDTPSAPPKHLLSRYSNSRPVMVLPSVREMRMHETRRREKKAW